MKFEEVKIGNQIWMAKNLSIDDGGEGIYHHNGETFYTWDAALRIAESVKGWHLPTKEEFETLINAVGGSSTAGTKLKSTIGWYRSGNGTDDFGFSAFPEGFRYLSGYFIEYGYHAHFWSAKELNSYDAYYMYLYFVFGEAYLGKYRKDNALSVRLVKD